MPITFIADVHVGNHSVYGGPKVAGVNRRCRLVIEALERAANAHANFGSHGPLVILGDLFDSIRPEPQVIAEVKRVLEGVGEVLIIKGNHDEAGSEHGDHALGPLDGVGGIVVFDGPVCIPVPTEDVDLLLVPFQTGMASDWLPEAVGLAVRQRNSGNKRRAVLCLHLGIHDDRIRKETFWASASHDAIGLEPLVELCALHKIDYVFAGNWHGIEEWAVQKKGRAIKVIQAGTVAPTGFDNPGLEHHGKMVMLHRNKPDITWHAVPGPRFLNIASEKELALAVQAAKGSRLHIRWACAPEEVAAARRAIAARVDLGDIEAGDAVVDKEVVQQQARKAAGAARSRSSLADSLEAFVRGMPLPDGVEREAVLARCRAYLGLA